MTHVVARFGIGRGGVHHLRQVSRVASSEAEGLELAEDAARAFSGLYPGSAVEPMEGHTNDFPGSRHQFIVVARSKVGPVRFMAAFRVLAVG